ncbi:hypothetical protein GCM10027019_18410 [Melaminivora jejuensis]|uniref:hypothetical protein n=1 Tax=Melaminivora jejuensis TaxID=1267217 RepID=UPI001ADFECF7|nr:hypothetical protein [Melaminivora jejuensis]UHJ65671.1 hypothetical protein LVC68_03895 [Melaminivora jejuensis]
MIWHLVGVLVMGLCLGGMAFFVRKATRNRLAKWWIPASAAAGMLGYLAYYDYDWYAFKRSQLPEGTVVIHEERGRSLLKPWSYLHPAVNSFVALDGKHSTRLQDRQRLVEYFEYHFHKDPLERLETQAYVLNCETQERVAFDDKSGRPTGPVENVSIESAIFRSACR